MASLLCREKHCGGSNWESPLISVSCFLQGPFRIPKLLQENKCPYSLLQNSHLNRLSHPRSPNLSRPLREQMIFPDFASCFVFSKINKSLFFFLERDKIQDRGSWKPNITISKANMLACKSLCDKAAFCCLLRGGAGKTAFCKTPSYPVSAVLQTVSVSTYTRLLCKTFGCKIGCLN